MVGPLRGIRPELNVARIGEPGEPEREHVQQHRGQQEHRYRHARDGRHHQSAVQQPARPQRAYRAKHDRDDHPQDRRRDHERERNGEPLNELADDVEVVLVIDDLAGEDQLHRVAVLDVDRLVEAELLADLGHRGGRGVAAGDRPRRVVARDDLEDPEHHDRRGEQQQDRGGRAPRDEPGHQVLTRTWARGSSASRTPSPTTLTLSTVSTSIAPGIRENVGVV